MVYAERNADGTTTLTNGSRVCARVPIWPCSRNLIEKHSNKGTSQRWIDEAAEVAKDEMNRN